MATSKQEYAHKWYMDHKEQTRERRRESNRKYYYAHREQVLERKHKYNKKTKETRRVREHAYRKPYLKVFIDNGGILVCSKCGSIDNLHIHHINGNHNDNSADNLQCLCDSCHTKEHNKRRDRNARGQYTT